MSPSPLARDDSNDYDDSNIGCGHFSLVKQGKIPETHVCIRQHKLQPPK